MAICLLIFCIPYRFRHKFKAKQWTGHICAVLCYISTASGWSQQDHTWSSDRSELTGTESEHWIKSSSSLTTCSVCLSERGDARALSAGALITGAFPSSARPKRERAPSEGNPITRGAQTRAGRTQTGELYFTEQGKLLCICKA